MKQRSREKVEKYIYKLLLSLNHKDKLPSIRSIMNECQVSQLSVQSALKVYEEKGMIKSKDRSGYCKIGKSDAAADFSEVDLIFCTSVLKEDPMMKFHAEFSHYLGRLCGDKWRGVRMHFLEENADSNSISQIAKSSKCRACIVISSTGSEIGDVLREHHVGYVNLFPDAYHIDPNAPNILIDNEQVVSNQLNHLVKLGHKKIGYLHSLKENEVIRDMVLRRESFLKQVLDLGLPMQSKWCQYGGYDSNSAIEGVNKMMSGDDRPTAMIVGDHHLPGVYAALNNLGLTPGKDFSVVGTDNLPITQMLSPMATSLEISKEDAVKLALEALENVLMGRDWQNVIPVKSTIIVRDSDNKLTN